LLARKPGRAGVRLITSAQTAALVAPGRTDVASAGRQKSPGRTEAGPLRAAAAKGLTWESPRGPVSIDPQTRDIVQTVYFRKVEKVGGALKNVEFEKIENVKDPVKARMAQ
jgi:hypothetical protein